VAVLPPTISKERRNDMDKWRTLLVEETARTVRDALDSWDRTARLLLLAVAFAAIFAALTYAARWDASLLLVR